MPQPFGVRPSCKHIHAMVNQSHPFVQKSSNDVWPQKMHFTSRNARPGHVVLFFSSAIYYLFSFGRVWHFFQCFPSLLALCSHCFDDSRKLVFVTICSQPVTHQSIHSMWPGSLFRQFEKKKWSTQEMRLISLVFSCSGFWSSAWIALLCYCLPWKIRSLIVINTHSYNIIMVPKWPLCHQHLICASKQSSNSTHGRFTWWARTITTATSTISLLFPIPIVRVSRICVR